MGRKAGNCSAIQINVLVTAVVHACSNNMVGGWHCMHATEYSLINLFKLQYTCM